jgi:hypothetical protein
MKTLSRSQWRLVGFGATAVALVFTLACIDRPMKRAIPTPHLGSEISIPQSAERDVDLLFMVDDSGSMLEEQNMLKTQFSSLMDTLKKMTGGLPNVHIGVVSSDLGAGGYPIANCMLGGGDAGHLLKGACTNPTSAPYIVDIEPPGCEITKVADASGITCTGHNCTQTNCTNNINEVAATTFVEDEHGCPRCRNYATESLEDVFKCMASLGTVGCGFEQQLESVKVALDNNSFNSGFLRQNAFLGVVWITDEDDCSASNPSLFDNTQTDINSQLGPLTSFRCFEFGITCDTNSRLPGTRENCVPRDDAGALLWPVSRYIDFFTQLKDPQMLVLAAIAGPTANGQVTVDLDAYSQPEVGASCTTLANGDAAPGFRISKVIEAFAAPEDLSWAFTSICNNSFQDALAGIGNKIKDLLDFQCLPTPLKGCSAVQSEFITADCGGITCGAGTACMPLCDNPGPDCVPVPRCRPTCAVNQACRPNCTVTDVYKRGTVDESKLVVPACLDVCPSGPCEGNSLLPNANQNAYANGHPLERDNALPVQACWHINYQPNCPGSNYAEIIISRQNDPPARSFAEVACMQITKTEQLCNDGADNDEDCLVDEQDEDCQ